MAIDIAEILRDHMKSQPYSCQCAECGKDLNCDVAVDMDFDLQIEVELCSCWEEPTDE